MSLQSKLSLAVIVLSTFAMSQGYYHSRQGAETRCTATHSCTVNSEIEVQHGSGLVLLISSSAGPTHFTVDGGGLDWHLGDCVSISDAHYSCAYWAVNDLPRTLAITVTSRILMHWRVTVSEVTGVRNLEDGVKFDFREQLSEMLGAEAMWPQLPVPEELR